MSKPFKWHPLVYYVCSVRVAVSITTHFFHDHPGNILKQRISWVEEAVAGVLLMVVDFKVVPAPHLSDIRIRKSPAICTIHVWMYVQIYTSMYQSFVRFCSLWLNSWQYVVDYKFAYFLSPSGTSPVNAAITGLIPKCTIRATIFCCSSFSVFSQSADNGPPNFFRFPIRFLIYKNQLVCMTVLR